MRPTAEYTIGLCDCRGTVDYRGEVVLFYERDDDGWVVCAECGNTPPEIAGTVPEDHHIELTIYHRLDDSITRRFRQHIPPVDKCPNCEADGVAERGISTEKSVEDGRIVHRCETCGRALAGSGPPT